MPFDDISARLDAIEGTLYQQAATTHELAERFGVSDDTIRRDLDRLQFEGAHIEKQGWNYRLTQFRPLPQVGLSLDELLSIYLALRLLARYSSTHNPHVATTLSKMNRALEYRSPPLAEQIARTATALEQRPPHPASVDALRALLRGWNDGTRVRMVYRRYGTTTRTVRTIAPYTIEPSGISGAIYVIGHDSLRDDVRTFRIDRIQEATLTHETYTIPDNFDAQRLLDAAWDVMWDETQPVEMVTLRIAPELAELIKARTWHPGQQLADLPDGASLLTVAVQVNREFLSWVLQWGADVSVVSPPAVRAHVTAEVQRLAAQYAIPVEEKGSGE